MTYIANGGAVGATGLYYDGVDLTQTFQLVDIDISVLPTITAKTLDLAQRAGSYFVAREVGERLITVTLRLDANTRDPMAIYKEWRSVSSKLSKTEPKQLRFNETSYCYALLVGDTFIEDEAYYGDVELTFKCFDPYIYGAEHTENLSNNTAKSITVAGTEPAFPVLTLTASATSVTITNVTTGDYISIPDTSNGASIVVDMEKQLTKVGNVYAPIYLSSRYFSIVGTQSVKVAGASGTLVYRERYL